MVLFLATSVIDQKRGSLEAYRMVKKTSEVQKKLKKDLNIELSMLIFKLMVNKDGKTLKRAKMRLKSEN